ncbi:hypothetical protein CRYUN_Cryun20dG0074500 [Craigia yunnanensis]
MSAPLPSGIIRPSQVRLISISYVTWHSGSLSLFLTPTLVISSQAVKNVNIRGSLMHRTAGSVLEAPYAPPPAPQYSIPFLFSPSNTNTQKLRSTKLNMSQQQPRRPQADQFRDQEPINFGEVFKVTGELASKPFGPEDASAMQSAETLVLGQTRKSGPTTVMQSAATANERVGLVSHDEADVDGDQGVAAIKSDADGEVWVTEAVGAQVVGQYIQPEVSAVTTPATFLAPDPITVGEALETAAFSAAFKPIDQSDAAAIQAAEMRATRSNEILPGGIASEAQSAATQNSRAMRFEDQTTLSDVLSDATLMLPRDKAVTREDADRVVAAELRNNPDMTTTPGGVGAAMAAAARRNQNSTI